LDSVDRLLARLGDPASAPLNRGSQADIADKGKRETTRMIEEAGGRALAVRCDVASSEDVKGALAQTIAAFGRLDIAFNNAGAKQAVKEAADTTDEEWDRIIAIGHRRCGPRRERLESR
jgi:NAD(P)-dependent dehydrogenase (short-subunit alcohol dehydrogenase family)